MQENPFTFLGQAISQLLSSNSATLQATGLDMFRGFAVILIVWFGVKAALSASQGHGGFHLDRVVPHRPVVPPLSLLARGWASQPLDQ